MSSLKTCPFCGPEGTLHINKYQINVGGWQTYVGCSKCGTTGPVADKEPQAIEAWNRRYEAPKPVVRRTARKKKGTVTETKPRSGGKRKKAEET